jgi:hypothetical protein
LGTMRVENPLPPFQLYRNNTFLFILSSVFRTCDIIQYHSIFLEERYASGQTCPCLSTKDCSWASNVIELLKSLYTRDVTRIRAVNFIRSLICDAPSQRIQCCSIATPNIRNKTENKERRTLTSDRVCTVKSN